MTNPPLSITPLQTRLSCLYFLSRHQTLAAQLPGCFGFQPRRREEEKNQKTKKHILCRRRVWYYLVRLCCISVAQLPVGSDKYLSSLVPLFTPLQPVASIVFICVLAERSWRGDAGGDKIMTVSLKIKERGTSEMGGRGWQKRFPSSSFSGCFVNVYLHPLPSLPFFNHPSASINLIPPSHSGPPSISIDEALTIPLMVSGIRQLRVSLLSAPAMCGSLYGEYVCSHIRTIRTPPPQMYLDEWCCVCMSSTCACQAVSAESHPPAVFFSSRSFPLVPFLSSLFGIGAFSGSFLDRLLSAGVVETSRDTEKNWDSSSLSDPIPFLTANERKKKKSALLFPNPDGFHYKNPRY